MSNTRNRRTPEEIIAETQAKLERLRSREVLKTAKDDPRLLPLTSAIEELEKQERDARKGLGNGPQSFGVRIASHQVWIDEIEAQQAHATALLDHVLKQKNALKDALSEFASTIAQDGNVTEDQIEQAATVETSAEVAALHLAMDEAIAARKEFNLAKRQPKREADSETETNQQEASN